MKVSLIIPTYNAEPYISDLLQILQKQTIDFEFIVIDSSSTDNTVSLLRPHADNIIIIPKTEFDHGGTRTKAAKVASGEILIFLTQDALPSSANTLVVLCEMILSKEAVAVYGRQLPYEHTNIFGRHLRHFNYSDTSYSRNIEDKEEYGIKTAFFSDSFSAYRKDILEEVEWFKDGLIVGEDMHVISKILMAEHTIAYNADACVYHSHTYTLIEDFKRYFDTGVFHAKESWIPTLFGKAEGEAKRYLLSELSYLIEHHAYVRIPEFFLRNGLKYIGYKLGQNYKSIPDFIVKRLSMHRTWWAY